MVYFPEGERFPRKGVRLAMVWNSSILRSTPADRATEKKMEEESASRLKERSIDSEVDNSLARRWRTTLVDPPTEERGDEESW